MSIVNLIMGFPSPSTSEILCYHLQTVFLKYSVGEKSKCLDINTGLGIASRWTPGPESRVYLLTFTRIVQEKYPVRDTGTKKGSSILGLLSFHRRGGSIANLTADSPYTS